MTEHTGLPDEIRRFYEVEGAEDGRIRSGIGRLELARMQEIVRRHLPPAPQRILDVGGATGVHSEWLLEDGHVVHMVEPVASQVAVAIDRLGSHPRFTAEVGEGTALGGQDDQYDVALLFGPLYHLQERSDRLEAWSEAARVVRPGGFVIAQVISRFASLFSGLAEHAIFDPVFRTIVERDLDDGRHSNPSVDNRFFTTAYFHHPAEVQAEAEEAGLEVREVVGVEGMAAWHEDLGERWDDPEEREAIMYSARVVESEPTLMGVGPHLMVIAEA